ncbi:MAG: ABC transporter ATP-binding protein [Pseudomonadales bacterium]
MLAVDGLHIGFDSDEGYVPVVEDVHFDLNEGQTLALVGESGCGKSLIASAIMQLLPPQGRIQRGTVALNGERLTTLDEKALQNIRGNRISMIFQEPMSALNPVFNVGSQIAESLLLHNNLTRTAALEQTHDLLASVGIPDPAARAKSYPHELSGGMRQRVLIAMALACEPDVLIADEPTTALDVTIQAQILDLMHDLQSRMGTTILFISHDFGVVSQMADDIAVMYAGRIVEQGSAADVLETPTHPYTRALLATTPRFDTTVRKLSAISGRVPGPHERDQGCHFRSRCTVAEAQCGLEHPRLIARTAGHFCSCHVVNADD